MVLNYGAEELELPMEMRRGEFTRAEILSRIGMIHMKITWKRFELTHLNKPKFLRRVNEITDGDITTTLSIPCTKQEFEQFDIWWIAKLHNSAFALRVALYNAGNT